MSTEHTAAARRAIHAWWRDLHPDAEGRGDRGRRARLRRCATAAEALLETDTLRLIERLRAPETGTIGDRVRRAETAARKGLAPPDDILSAVACLAVCLAAAEPEAETPAKAAADPTDDRARMPDFAAVLGRPKGDGAKTSEAPARLSALRFSRLLRAPDWEARQRELRRAVKLIDKNRFDVGRFGTDLLWWGPNVRRAWVLTYHQEFETAVQETAQ